MSLAGHHSGEGSLPYTLRLARGTACLFLLLFSVDVGQELEVVHRFSSRLLEVAALPIVLNLLCQPVSVRLDHGVDLLRFADHLLILLYLLNLHHGLLGLSITDQQEQVLRLAVLHEVNEFYLVVVTIGHLLAKQFKHMFAMVVPHHTILVSIADHQSFLLELVPISEADESALREAEEVDAIKIVLQLESQMLSLVLLLIDFV